MTDHTLGHKPRRSVLYMPGANTRALGKAATLDCDGLIFDLEDAVAPDAKSAARANVVEALKTNNYGHRELIVRVNPLASEWGVEDLSAVAGLPIHGILFPKIESDDMLNAAATALVDAAAAQSQAPLPLWAMVESPLSILQLPRICAASARLAVLVLGTSDLVRELRAQHTVDRQPLAYALSAAVTAARAHGLDVLDGVHLDFRNLDSFRSSCEQGRAMGFDGRSLIHPSQIDIANEIYGYSAADVEHAERIIAVWKQAQASGLGVVELEGQLIENLHAADAERLLAISAALSTRFAT